MKGRIEELYMTPYAELHSRTGKRRAVIIGSSLLFVGLIVGGCLGWAYGRKSKQANDLQEKEPYNKAHIGECSNIPDDEKLDCYPEGNVDESKCADRGCCYSTSKNASSGSSLPPLNVPYCYYPSDYTGYVIKNVDKTPRRLKIQLQRNQSSGFPEDVLNVNVLVSFIDDSSLRIKITDADSPRYEVPIQLHYQTKEIVDPLYDVKLDKGILTVLRKSTGSVIFRTNLARLVYSDRFLQLSSDLASPYIYGIGEHYESILRSVNWTRFTLFNADLQPIPNHSLYGSHPFYMALEKDGKANGVFLLNSNAMDVILQPSPAITFRPIGGIFDFYIMAGPTPKNVTEQYSNIVGKTFMPPFWSLGFQLCRYGYNSLETTKETMLRTINAGIPLDVQWNDIDYMDRFKDFTYDKTMFSGLPKFVDDIHSRGMHYVIMIDPGISNSEKVYAPYDEGMDDGVFVRDSNGTAPFVGKVWTDGTLVYPDFTHPAAIPYWTRQFRRLYKEIKYDGVWIDMNEPSNFNNGGFDGCPDSPYENPQYLPAGISLIKKTLCMTSNHYQTTHYNEHNLYAYHEAVATYHAIRSVRKKRPFIISRASFAGQGVFSGHWSGDIDSTWEDMRYSIRSMINFNLYAIPMIGSDICGFGLNTTIDLCARWQTLGAFYPFSRNHNTEGTIEQDPVALGPNVTLAARVALQKRYTLLPYLYTLFYRSHVFGETVARALFLEFPEDKNTYGIDEQFMWGSGLMIVPALYKDKSVVEAYFPKAVWYNAVDGSKLNVSGEKMLINISQMDIFLGIRGGTILASLAPGLTTTQTRKGPFTLAAALDENKNAEGELYWDDGDSLDTYENGYYNLIQFKVTNNTLKTTVVHQGYKTDMLVQGVNIIGYGDPPSTIMVNGHYCNKSEIDGISGNSTGTEDFIVNSMNFTNILGVGTNYTTDYITEDCSYFYVLTMLFIQMKPVSLLSELEVTWN